MTNARYHSYRRALTLIGALNPDAAGDEAPAQLRDYAEDLLLTSDDAPHVEEVAEDAALMLTQLTVRGAISRLMADELWRAICASGPEPAGLLETAA
jgi:hypothetical protein